MCRDVVITGTGLVSPLGNSGAAFHDTLARACAERPTFTNPEARIAFTAESFKAESYLGDRNLKPLDRAGCMLACAAHLALCDAGWSQQDVRAAQVGLVVGTMYSTVHTIGEFDRRALRDGPCYASPMDFANTVLNAPAGQTAIWHGLRGVNSTVVAGAASGLQALTHAVELIRAGRARAILAGGVEELSHESSCGFRRRGLLCRDANPLPFDEQSSGFLLGEGAALLMLEDAESATERGARILGSLAGHGLRFDPRRGQDEERAVDAAVGAMNLALEESKSAANSIDCVSASARGDPTSDRREALALRQVFSERGDDLAITAMKGQTGDTLGASGAMQVISMLECLRRRVIPGIPGVNRLVDGFLLGKVGNQNRETRARTCLINSIGFDGHNCSLVLTAA